MKSKTLLKHPLGAVGALIGPPGPGEVSCWVGDIACAAQLMIQMGCKGRQPIVIGNFKMPDHRLRLFLAATLAGDNDLEWRLKSGEISEKERASLRNALSNTYQAPLFMLGEAQEDRPHELMDLFTEDLFWMIEERIQACSPKLVVFLSPQNEGWDPPSHQLMERIKGWKVPVLWVCPRPANMKLFKPGFWKEAGMDWFCVPAESQRIYRCGRRFSMESPRPESLKCRSGIPANPNRPSNSTRSRNSVLSGRFTWADGE